MHGFVCDDHRLLAEPGKRLDPVLVSRGKNDDFGNERFHFLLQSVSNVTCFPNQP